MMRLKNIIPLSVIVCIGGVIFYFACKYTYDFKVAELKDKAKKTFVEALDQEWKNRKPESDISLNMKSGTVMVDVPDTVYWEDETGRHWYVLDPKKNQMNITNNSAIRALHSSAFGKKSLLSDSLNLIWSKKLRESDISFKSALCISIIDTDGNVQSQDKCLQSEWCHSSNLVLTFYIGYACEIEVVGYLCYSVWNMIYKEILLYLLLYVTLGYGFYKSFFVFRRKINSLRRKETVEIVKEVPVEVIKEVPVEVLVIKEVQKVDATSLHSYKLSDHIIFDPVRNVILVDGVEKIIQPQSSRLLELFLEEGGEKYILEASLIMKKLWSDKSGNGVRMQKAVARLRSSLHEIDPSSDIMNKINAYQLIFLQNQPIQNNDENVDEMEHF